MPYTEKILQFFPAEISQELREFLTEKKEIITLKKRQRLPIKNNNLLIFIILEGSVVRYIATPDGDDRAIAFHTEAFMPIVGNMYIRQEKSLVSFELIANEDCKLLSINAEKLLPIALQDPIYMKFASAKMVENFAIQNQIQNHFIGLHKEDFLKWFSEHFRFIFQRFKAKDIANFMGVSATWLSLLQKKAVKK